MSIVIAYKRDGVVYMGADTKRSQGNWARTIETVNDMKICLLAQLEICLTFKR